MKYIKHLMSCSKQKKQLPARTCLAKIIDTYHNNFIFNQSNILHRPRNKCKNHATSKSTDCPKNNLFGYRPGSRSHLKTGASAKNRARLPLKHPFKGEFFAKNWSLPKKWRTPIQKIILLFLSIAQNLFTKTFDNLRLPMKCLLLGTAGCHLCEEAETLVKGCLKAQIDFKIEHIDIVEYAKWQKKYALRIPVLLHEASGQTLDWPFTETQVIDFIKTITS
jgi:hypothetical protein